MTDFMIQGPIVRHLRRMRRLYGDRCRALQEALAHYCGAWLDVGDATAGMHLVAWLKDGLDDKRVAAAVREAGIAVRPISDYYLTHKPPQSGLLLGFTTVNRAQLTAGARKLGELLATLAVR